MTTACGITNMDRDTIDETAMEEIVEILDNADVPERELDFSEDFQGEHEYGRIYESIEDELPEGTPEPDDESFDEDLPESFFEEL